MAEDERFSGRDDAPRHQLPRRPLNHQRRAALPPEPKPAQAQPLDELEGLLTGGAPQPAAAGAGGMQELQALLDGSGHRRAGTGSGAGPYAVPPARAQGPGQPRQGVGGAGNLGELESLLGPAERHAAEGPGGTGQYKHRRKRPRRRLRDIITIQRVLLSFVLLVCAGIISFVAFFFYTTRNDHLWLQLETIPYRSETVLYSTDAATGAQQVYYALPATQNKEYVEIGQMPQALKDAFVAVEDKNFYTHAGFDFKRTVYAVFNELAHSVTGSYLGGDTGRKQGASTITQQLIKNLTRDDADSAMSGYMRKLRELCRAVRLEWQYDKDEILEAYLNVISFTGNTAGVQAEARKLFGKTVDQLSLAECASLAAITRNPAGYNPVTKPEAHLERRNYVLGEMLAEGYISQNEHDDAVAQPLSLAGNAEARLPSYVTDYFTDTVIDEVITQLAADYNLTRKEASNLLYNGGLRIYTTVNPTLQHAMQQVMESAAYHPLTRATVQLPVTDDDGNAVLNEAGKPMYEEVRVTPQAAMVSLNYDGGIAAIVGGLGEKQISRGFNRATSAVRQVGSTMKPISPYVTALEDNKITWSSSFLDEAVLQVEDPATGQLADWPANVNNQYTGRDVLVREGISRSVNTVAVRVGQKAGVSRMYNFVTKDLGITTFTKDDKDLGPLVLGSSTYGITPLQMAKAYAMFGNGGYTVNPHSYTRVTGGTGTVYLQADTAKKRVISEDTAFIMNRLLRNVLVDGTAAGLSVPGDMDSVGKTGTTSDNRDHWFIGLTPYYVTASWYGYDENLPLLVNNSAHPPTLAWRSVMQAGQAGLPAAGFPTAAGVSQQSYCTQSGCAAGASCPAAQGWYKRGHGPAGSCPLH